MYMYKGKGYMGFYVQDAHAVSCMHELETATRLEVIIEGEVTTVLALGLIVLGLLSAEHDTGLLVVTDTLLEEVGLATKGDILHEVEGVGRLVHLLVAKGDKKTVGDELNVLLHEVGVHAEEGARQGLSKELLLNGDGIGDDVLNDLLVGTTLEVGVEKAGEVGVKTLVTRDKLVGEGQARHETTLLQPENGGKGAAEEDALDGGKSNETLGKRRLLVRDPLKGPLSLSSNARNGLNGVEEIGALGRLLDISVDEQRVGLGMDVLHHDLESIEAASLGDLDLGAESLNEVLVNNAIRGGKEGKDMRDEELLILSQAVVPVVKILGQINLLSSPERSLVLLVHLPDLMVLDGKEDEAVRVLLEEGLIVLLYRGNGLLGVVLLLGLGNLRLPVGHGGDGVLAEVLLV
jgi:hypothetical protein